MTLGPGPWLVREVSGGTVVARRVIGANSFWARFRGLMGRASLADGEGLYLPESSIHMFFMRFAIDALFVGAPDGHGNCPVVEVRAGLRPWRSLVMPVRGATGVVELAAGTLERAGVQAGSTVRFESLAAASAEAGSPES